MLPPELIHLILDCLHDDTQSLGPACASAGRALLQTSRYHVLNELRLTFVRATRLEPLLKASSTLASSIATLVYEPFACYQFTMHPQIAIAFLHLLPNLIDLCIQDRAFPCIGGGQPGAYIHLDDVWELILRVRLILPRYLSKPSL